VTACRAVCFRTARDALRQATQPKLIVVDEPLSAADVSILRQMLNLRADLP
jgi:ABC-type oligopeptide transport system ATPase subunit